MNRISKSYTHVTPVKHLHQAYKVLTHVFSLVFSYSSPLPPFLLLALAWFTNPGFSIPWSLGFITVLRLAGPRRGLHGPDSWHHGCWALSLCSGFLGLGLGYTSRILGPMIARLYHCV